MVEQLEHHRRCDTAALDAQGGNLLRSHFPKASCGVLRLSLGYRRILPVEMNSAPEDDVQGSETPRKVLVRLDPEHARDDAAIRNALGRQGAEYHTFTVLKRSLDARRRPAMMEMVVGLDVDSIPVECGRWRDVSKAPSAVIVGAGPAGLYCALRLVELGIRPVVLERGQPVRERRRDLVKLIREGRVDPDSNYCFGEGGAGTYSDGKLYTRSKKRGGWRKVLGWFVEHGADPDILVDTHPHIGTNKLPAIISAMRERIVACGGEVRFGQRVVGVMQESDGRVTGVRLLDGHLEAEAVVLATGHGARDVFEWMESAGLALEGKPFAMGVRIEHPQDWIDARQYRLKQDEGADSLGLPPAAYSLVTQTEGGGVFSFCMCPGGVIAPCATEDGEVVTNGWSPSRRNNPWANSGIVTTVDAQAWEEAGFEGVLGGLAFQRSVERACHSAAGGGQKAPAQRLTDFVARRPSRELPDCSYLAGLTPVDLTRALPAFIVDRLIEGIRDFDRKMPGYIHPQAIVVAPESRTSSPVRMLRDRDSLAMPGAPGLYPCGEGAGYAGGIVSAAMDGMRVAEALAVTVEVNPD